MRHCLHVGGQTNSNTMQRNKLDTQLHTLHPTNPTRVLHKRPLSINIILEQSSPGECAQGYGVTKDYGLGEKVAKFNFAYVHGLTSL